MLPKLIPGFFQKKKAVTPATSEEEPVTADLDSLVSRLEAEQRRRVYECEKIFVRSEEYDYTRFERERTRGRHYDIIVGRLLATEERFAAFERWYKGAEAFPHLDGLLHGQFIKTSIQLLKIASPESLVMYGDLVSGIASILRSKRCDYLLWSQLKSASEAALQITRVSPSSLDLFVKTWLAIQQLMPSPAEVDLDFDSYCALSRFASLVESPDKLERVLVNALQLSQADLDCNSYVETCSHANQLLDAASFAKWFDDGLQLMKGSTLEFMAYFSIYTKHGQAALRKHMPGIGLDEVADVLQPYCRALAGQGFILVPMPQVSAQLQRPHTDGTRIWLPPKLQGYGTGEGNFKAYKVLVTLQAAKAEFGTFSLKREDVQGLVGKLEASYGTKASGDTPLKFFADAFPVPELAMTLFELIEGQRVVNRVREAYKGIRVALDEVIKREMELMPLHQCTGPDANLLMEGFMRYLTSEEFPAFVPEMLRPILEGLYKSAVEVTGHSATVVNSLHATAACYELINVKCCENTNKLGIGSDLKVQFEIGELPSLFFQGEFEMAAGDSQDDTQDEDDTDTQDEDDTDTQDEDDTSLFFQGEFEMAAGDSQDDTQYKKTNGKFVYPEWSIAHGDYLTNWCKVEEFNLPPAENVPALQSVKQQLQLAQLFEKIYPGTAVKRKKQPEGEDIDIDTAVEFLVDRKAGISSEPNVYIHRKKQLGGIAAAFLIDASPSALEPLADGRRVIDAERESLELLIAGMEQVDHTCGIFGFSGYKRSNVRIYVVKHFDEAFDRRRLYSLEPRPIPINDKPHESSVVTAQSSPIEFGTYTGPAVRHLTRLLAAREEQTRLLVVLTDSGHRADSYMGEYARADVKMTFLEAKTKGVHPLAISFGTVRTEELVESYGRFFIEVSNPEELVEKLPRIYVALTR